MLWEPGLPRRKQGGADGGGAAAAVRHGAPRWRRGGGGQVRWLHLEPIDNGFLIIALDQFQYYINLLMIIVFLLRIM